MNKEEDKRTNGLMLEGARKIMELQNEIRCLKKENKKLTNQLFGLSAQKKKLEFDYIELKENLDYYFLENKRLLAKKNKILYLFDGLWNCLKFEKMGAKVIGYTFKKEDIDNLKEVLNEMRQKIKQNEVIKTENGETIRRKGVRRKW